MLDEPLPAEALYPFALTGEAVASGGRHGDNVGPMLLGVARPAHILTSSVTVRGIVNMSALAVVDAQVNAASPSAAD